MSIFLEMLVCASFCTLVDYVRDNMKERRQLRNKEAELPKKEKRRKGYDRLDLPRL